MITIRGNSLVPGKARGELVISTKPISFLGMVDPVRGEIVAGDTDLLNIRIAGKILAFPYMVGSTVAPYIIYRMKKLNTMPAAIAVQRADASLASGCAVTKIPLIDQVETDKLLKYKLKIAIFDGKNGIIKIDDK
ncbi:MAG: DUF126 domain-containing protein [Conexivisphaerales archaeon]